MNPALADLLHHPAIWRGDALAAETVTLASGYPELDAELPGGGWPRGAITEILLAREGIGELRLAAPALAALTREGAWVVLIGPPHEPYAPALAEAGIALSRLLRVHATAPRDRLWACEQALRATSCGAVLMWLDSVGEQEVRRLQLAAREGGGWGLLYRSPGVARQSSWAALRLALSAAPSGLEVRILKRRGGVAGTVLHLALPGSSFFMPS